MALEKRARERASRHGIVELATLLELGFSKDAVRRRVDAGWLTRLHAGIFALGEPTDLGRIDAALRAGGFEATATAGSAAAMEGLLPYPATVSLVVPRGTRRPPGLDVREATTMPDWYRLHGLRATRVSETLLALAARHYGEAREALDHAVVKRRTSTELLHAFLDANAGRGGIAVLRDLVEGPRTRSQLERLFLRLLRDARLPLPLVNVRVNGHLVDFYWPEHRLVVETDPTSLRSEGASHGRRGQWERDHARDLDHFAARVETVRVTYLQLTRSELQVIAALAARLL